MKANYKKMKLFVVACSTVDE